MTREPFAVATVVSLVVLVAAAAGIAFFWTRPGADSIAPAGKSWVEPAPGETEIAVLFGSVRSLDDERSLPTASVRAE